MSRAHMLYDNKPLESVPVIPVTWEKEWKPEEVFRCKGGDGAIVEGVLQGRSRFSLTDPYSGPKKWRYIVLHIEVLRAVKRKFDSSGKEIEPDFGDSKKVSTGYLMSSYRTCSAGESDKLSAREVVQMTGIPQLDKLTESKTAKGQNNWLQVWSEERNFEQMELLHGDHIRLKTKGAGPYIDSITKLDEERSKVSNYAGGEHVGTSWTDKVMTFKGKEPATQDQAEGVDDDEWDD